MVVPQKLSWGRTFEVFGPQNGINWVNWGPKQLCVTVAVTVTVTVAVNEIVTVEVTVTVTVTVAGK